MVVKIDLSKWATKDGNGMELSPQVDNDPQGMEKEFPITERK